MKRWIIKGLLLVVLAIGTVLQLSAQTEVTVWMNNGAVQSYLMTESDRMYFEDNETLVVEIAVYDKGVRSDRFNLDDIRKITCSETENVSEASSASVYLSPNPVHNAFMISNLNGKETIHIYALDGRLVKSIEASENQLVDISDFPIGIYLVKTEHQTLKMIKL